MALKDKIKYLIMDVDGTLTDGKIYMGSDNEVFKAFNVKDGYGIYNILRTSGIIPVVLTGRTSKIVENRCEELKIQYMYQGISNKLDKLIELVDEWNCSFDNIAYIGDDINDIYCMKKVKRYGGVVACPADSVSEILLLSDFISSKNGGEGAVREFIEWLIKN